MWFEALRGFDVERALGLRPPNPRVAVELDRDDYVLVRVKRGRRGVPVLDGHAIEHLAEPGVPATLFDPSPAAWGDLAARVRRLYEAARMRPGRVSLVLPDNLAKLALLTLPEKPPSRRQLDEIVRFKLRRSVPFRLSEAVVSYHPLGAEGQGLSVLVAVVRRALVELVEKELESIGARPGLVDLSTPNVLNLCRAQLAAAAAAGGDVALLNCAPTYFSLVILREGRVIFFRCKPHGADAADAAASDGLLAREVAGSLSYYAEKLSGRGIGALLVRSVDRPVEVVLAQLEGLGVGRVAALDPAGALAPADGASLDPLVAQRLAPAAGAAGRG
jgi:type IV pilus assembly protein PilM